MASLLIMIGGACIGAALFGKQRLGDKHVAVLIAGIILLGTAAGLSGMGGDCGTGWDGRGSFSDC